MRISTSGAWRCPRLSIAALAATLPQGLVGWLQQPRPASSPLSVLVGAASRHAPAGLRLTDAYALARRHAPAHVLGGIAIAERHARTGDEHERILAKTEAGCRFFVTQAVYDVNATKSLLSDYALATRQSRRRAGANRSDVFTLRLREDIGLHAVAGNRLSALAENELRHAPDPLATSVGLCRRSMPRRGSTPATKGSRWE